MWSQVPPRSQAWDQIEWTQKDSKEVAEPDNVFVATESSLFPQRGHDSGKQHVNVLVLVIARHEGASAPARFERQQRFKHARCSCVSRTRDSIARLSNAIQNRLNHLRFKQARLAQSGVFGALGFRLGVSGVSKFRV